MVVLKKIKASTLMETLVASVLIVIVFMMASMVLNNMFSNTVKNDISDIETYINELEYLYKNEKLVLPYYGAFESWHITIQAFTGNDEDLIIFEAVKGHTNQTYSRQFHVDQ
ncbi:hypothetical protein [Seonamhaeicola maritimus]|uniref:Type II secretion system protein n=1 Tax=Seonamhaeicola maritimus TaxID=2591822 RepID=A0A5C7GDS7_9FLAO|nr:hypothetical protein [Seonamhaeicola maritimus]TXG34841.1 hypothetical protein FUA22_17215 [Seonamhaeicola maritimus]